MEDMGPQGAVTCSRKSRVIGSVHSSSSVQSMSGAITAAVVVVVVFFVVLPVSTTITNTH
jgi:hypothetical protein